MKCQFCSDLLSQYIDRELSEEKRKLVKEHLDQCPECMEEYNLMCSTIDCVNRLECVEPPADFQECVMREIKAKHVRKKAIWPVWGSLTFGSLAAAALVMMMIVNNPAGDGVATPRMNVVANKPVKTTLTGQAENNQEQPWEDFYKRQGTMNPGNSQAEKQLAAVTNRSSVPGLVQNVSYGQTAPVAAGAANRPGAGVAKQMGLVRQHRAWSGEDSKVAKRRSFIINTPSEADQVWKTTGITPLPLSKMDWSKNQLIALFVGEQNGHGYEIQLKNIQKSNGRMIVTYHINQPERMSSAKQSNPFLVFEMKKTNLPIEFIEE